MFHANTLSLNLRGDKTLHQNTACMYKRYNDLMSIVEVLPLNPDV